MGICTNSKFIQKCVLCDAQYQENNLIVINLDKHDEEKKKENKKQIIENKNDNDNLKINNNNELVSKNNIKSNKNIIIYRIDSKFSPILINNTGNKCNNINNINNNKTLNINYNRQKGSNKYNTSNDNCEKLIHFTTFVNNVSATTNSILK